MATIERFEDIEAWKLARELSKLVYEVTSIGNFAKDFELRGQARKASVSVMSNIAEGFERDGNKEFLHFLSIAKGSCGEVRAQMYVALDQNYISQEQFFIVSRKAIETSRAISGFMRYLQKSELRGRKLV